MRSAAACLPAGVLGCSDGGGFIPRTDGGTGDGPQALHDGGATQDLAGLTCASIHCGANASCDPKSLTCSCNPGFGGDPKAGCVAQTPCGNCPAFSHCDSKSNTCACEPGYQLMNNDGVEFTNATVSVTRKDDNTPLAVEIVQLPDGYGVNAICWTQMMWAPQVGKTYTVQIGGTSLGAVSYDVQPVSCP